MSQTVPFSILREAYQHALDTWHEYRDCPETLRDYWPTCLEEAILDYEKARDRAVDFT